ncbi:MAG: GAP family protein [Candidatus Colwellbacteria bacterium]|nr:GAP family protein [Candidatus Colwellbacteria bacterium]
MKKIYWLILFAAVLLGGAFYFGSMSSAQLLWDISSGGKLLLPLVVASAMVDSINPCAFSILLLTIAFLFSLGRLRSNILRIGLLYILGIFLAYLAIGLGILQVLHIFSIPHFMAKVGAIMLIGFGIINALEVLVPNFPIKLHIPHSAHNKMAVMIDQASLPTAFLLGAFVGICEFPCTGGPYLAVLGLLHDQATFLNGLAYLIFYNIIFVLPLLVILFVASDKKVLEKVQVWQREERKTERLIAGILMVGLGSIIYFV